MFNGKIHYKWQFSIAMLNYQRVSIWSYETVGLQGVSYQSRGLCEVWVRPEGIGATAEDSESICLEAPPASRKNLAVLQKIEGQPMTTPKIRWIVIVIICPSFVHHFLMMIVSFGDIPGKTWKNRIFRHIQLASFCNVYAGFKPGNALDVEFHGFLCLKNGVQNP